MRKHLQFLFVATALLAVVSGSAVAEGMSPVLVTDTVSNVSAPSHQIIVYYLYVQPRCQTCLDIEAYAKEAVESTFAAQLEAGVIEWHAYDTGLPEYAHYWDDFALELKSLVIADMRRGERVRWKICDKVWDLVEDKPAFLKYVENEIRAYLTDD